MQTRAKWIDQLKGLGIIAVVIGHHQSLMQQLEIREFIYSWHMPLFFALSGMTLLGASRRAVLIRLGSLLWVYLAVSLALLPVGLLAFKNVALHYEGTLIEKFIHAIYGILYGSAHTIRVGPLWFIPCLILSISGAWTLIKTTEKIESERKKLAFLLAASVVHILAGSYFLNSLKTPDYIWRLDWGTISESGYFFTANIVPLTIGFVIFGAFISRLFHFLTNRKIAYLSAGAGLIWFYIFSLGGAKEVELSYGVLRHWLWAPLGSLCAILFISGLVYFSKINSKALISIGATTLPILVSHSFISSLFAQRGGTLPALPLALLAVIFGILIPWAANQFFLMRAPLGQFIFYPRAFVLGRKSGKNLRRTQSTAN